MTENNSQKTDNQFLIPKNYEFNLKGYFQLGWKIFKQNIGLLKKIVIVTLLCIQINGVTILVIRCEIFARDLSIMDLIEGNWAIIYHDDNA